MNRQGTSLVELLVALQLLVLGMGGVAGLVVGSVRSTHHARRVDDATRELAYGYDSLKWAGAAGDGEVRRPSGWLRWSVGSVPGSQSWIAFEGENLPALRVEFLRSWGP